MDKFNKTRALAYAEVFQERGGVFAFVAVMHDHESHDGKTRACLGVAVANSPGYHPVPQFYFAADRHEDADSKADALNRDILGISDEDATAIQISTMGGQPYRAPKGFAEERAAAMAAFDAEFLTGGRG